MYTASKDLCKELYELSGWTHPVVLVKESIPLYDLGYLIRKLPQQYSRKGLFHVGRLNMWHFVNGWAVGYEDSNITVKADTPEDALAKLAIELFKQGILTKQGKE